MRIQKLLDWLRDTPKDEATRRCAAEGTSIGYVRQVAYGNKVAGLKSSAIERATCGAVTRQDLRPNDYHLIWPDLPAPVTEEA